MNKMDELKVEEVLGLPCNMAKNRDWLYDHRFVAEEDHDLHGNFFREIKYKDGYMAISVELSDETGLCTATLDDVVTNDSKEALYTIPIEEWDAIMETKNKFTSDSAEEAVKKAVLAAIRREECLSERYRQHVRGSSRNKGNGYNNGFNNAYGSYGNSTASNGRFHPVEDDDDEEEDENENGLQPSESVKRTSGRMTSWQSRQTLDDEQLPSSVMSKAQIEKEREKLRKREEFIDFMKRWGLLPEEKEEDEDEDEEEDRF